MLFCMNGKPTAKSRGYLRYGVILALLAVIRIFEATTAGAPWRTIDSSWLLTFCALAFVISLVTCLLTRRIFTPVTAVLLSGLAGGTATLVANSIPGMVIGCLVGVLAAFDVMQRFSLRTLAFVAMYLLPTIALGWGVGYFGARWNWLRVEAANESPVIVTVLSILCVIGVAWPILLSTWRKHKWMHLIWKVPLCLLVAIITEPIGVTHDSSRRSSLFWESNVYAYSSVPLSIVREPEVFTRGFYYFTNLATDSGLSSEVGEELHDIHTIAKVYVQPSYEERERPFHTDGFRAADFREVTELTVGANRHFDDTALHGFRNCELMAEIRIHGGESSVTDRGLTALSKMKWLGSLTLDGTRIDGSGLKHLNPSAPLVNISLSNTKVNDEALQHLANYSLATLRLRRTQVTGSGLKYLNVDLQTGLDGLDLSLSLFDESHIPSLPKSLNSLELDGIRLSQSGAEAFATRFADGLTRLSIAGSGINDASLAKLAPLKLASLRVDASQLTLEAAEVLARVPDLELNYDAKSWFASDRTFEDLVAHRKSMEKAILDWRKQLVLGYPRAAQFVTSIDNLVVTAEMVDALNRIPECSLIQARIDGGPGYLEGEAVVQDLDPSDLYRWFPRVLAE